MGFSGGSDDKESTCIAGDLGSIPGWEDPLERRAWQPTPVFLPGESLDRGAWQAVVPGMTELDVTEHTQALADSDAHSH